MAAGAFFFVFSDFKEPAIKAVFTFVEGHRENGWHRSDTMTVPVRHLDGGGSRQETSPPFVRLRAGSFAAGEAPLLQERGKSGAMAIAVGGVGAAVNPHPLSVALLHLWPPPLASAVGGTQRGEGGTGQVLDV